MTSLFTLFQRGDNDDRQENQQMYDAIVRGVVGILEGIKLL